MNKFILSFIFCCAGISVTAMQSDFIHQRGQVDTQVFGVDHNETLRQLLGLAIVQGWQPSQQVPVVNGIAQGTVVNDQQPVVKLWDVRGQEESFSVGSPDKVGVGGMPRNVMEERAIGENNE